MSPRDLLNKINAAILNPLILLVFAVATITFVYGLVQFIGSETSDKAREEGKKKILYGLLGMFIMFSAYGLIRLIMGTFGIQNPPNAYIPF
jgi:cytochrome c biogenesis protein CcdA